MNVNELLISVIIPIYNTDKYLDDCILSVVNQSYRNLDIILINDGSTDNSKFICEKWVEKDARIRLINQVNMGAAMAKNTGLDAIKGDLFIILDSDDLLHKKNIEILYNSMEKTNSDIVEACYTIDFNKFYNTEIDGVVKNKSTETFNTEESLRELIMGRRFHQTPWNKLYKVELLKDIRFPKGKYIDDEYWTYKLFANAKKITWVSSNIYYYRQHKKSIMGRDYSVKRLDGVNALYDRYNFMKKNFPNLTDLAYKSFLGSCVYNFQKLCLLKDLDKDKKFRNDLWNKVKLSMKNNKIGNFPIKSRLLFYSFYKCPYVVSKIRNILKRGI